MAESRLMDATEAKAFGLTDEVVEPVKITAHFDPAKLPPEVRARMDFAPRLIPKDDDDTDTLRTGDPDQDYGLLPVDENGMRVPPAEGGETTPPYNDLGSEPSDADTENGGTVRRSKRAAARAVEALKIAARVSNRERERPRRYGRKEMKKTMELCALAGASAQVANEFIAKKTPVERVRRALMDRRVLADAQSRILGRQPAFDAARSEKAAQTSWQKAIDGINAKVAMPEVGKTVIK